MAARRSEVELAELAAFVNDLFEWGGYARRSEWATDAGFPAPNLSDVMNGKAGIEGYNLMRLYKSAERRAATERPVMTRVPGKQAQVVPAAESLEAERTAMKAKARRAQKKVVGQ